MYPSSTLPLNMSILMTHPIHASLSTPFDVGSYTLKNFWQQSYADNHDVDETDELGQVVKRSGMCCRMRAGRR